eukprot:6198323-Pleurochrysis_carterae.AAC.2
MKSIRQEKSKRIRCAIDEALTWSSSLVRPCAPQPRPFVRDLSLEARVQPPQLHQSRREARSAESPSTTRTRHLLSSAPQWFAETMRMRVASDAGSARCRWRCTPHRPARARAAWRAA